jgi:hypothetical protein
VLCLVLIQMTDTSIFIKDRINSLVQKNKTDIGQINIDSNNREIKFLKALNKIHSLKSSLNNYGFQILIDKIQHQKAN